jgi:hypothetical protein
MSEDPGVRDDEPQEHDEPHDEHGLDLARSVARGLAGRTGARRKR